MTETTAQNPDIFNNIATDLSRSREIAEENLRARAEADIVAKDNKILDIESTRADLDIQLRKAGRAVREQWLQTAGQGLSILSFSKQAPMRPLTSILGFVKGMIALRDAYSDKADVAEKQKSYEERIGSQEQQAQDTADRYNEGQEQRDQNEAAQTTTNRQGSMTLGNGTR